jgi:hypothetical protein
MRKQWISFKSFLLTVVYERSARFKQYKLIQISSQSNVEILLILILTEISYHLSRE